MNNFQAIAGMQPGVVWPQGLVAAPGMINGAMMAPMAQHVMPGSKSLGRHRVNLGLKISTIPPRVKSKTPKTLENIDIES